MSWDEFVGEESPHRTAFARNRFGAAAFEFREAEERAERCNHSGLVHLVNERGGGAAGLGEVGSFGRVLEAFGKCGSDVAGVAAPHAAHLH